MYFTSIAALEYGIKEPGQQFEHSETRRHACTYGTRMLRNITFHDITNALAHLIPVDTTPSHAHNRRLKPWSPLNKLLTHVILVGVACGSYIRECS